jgi:carboxypeptidase family protein
MSTRQSIGCVAVLFATAMPVRAPGQLARLRGRVFDSVAAMPLAGAHVELVNADDRARVVFSTTSDSLGRFVVDSVARGHYIAGFLHPLLDSLGLALSQRPLVVEDNREMRVDLAVPSPERIEVALCGKGGTKDSLGVVLGYVLNAHSFAALDSATVIAEWAEFAIGQNHVSRTFVSRTARTGSAGWFAVCGIPSSASIVLRAVSGTDTSGAIEVDVPKSGIARRTLYVDHEPAVATPSSDSTRVSTPPNESVGTKRRRATVRGWVRTEDGVPIPGAQVTIFASDIVAETNLEGEFALEGVPGGTQTLMTRAIGFVPDERAVDLTDRHDAVTIGLLAVRRFLDTVQVRANRNSFSSTVGFDDRRKGGAGRFFTAADVEKLHPQELTDLLRHTPLLDLSTDNAHNVKIRIRGDQTACTPAIFVDGKQLVYWELADLNSLVQPDELVGMEVYSAAMTPAEFRTKNACGALVVWTRTPERLRAKR